MTHTAFRTSMLLLNTPRATNHQDAAVEISPLTFGTVGITFILIGIILMGSTLYSSIKYKETTFGGTDWIVPVLICVVGIVFLGVGI